MIRRRKDCCRNTEISVSWDQHLWRFLREIVAGCSQYCRISCRRFLAPVAISSSLSQAQRLQQAVDNIVGSPVDYSCAPNIRMNQGIFGYSAQRLQPGCIVHNIDIVLSGLLWSQFACTCGDLISSLGEIAASCGVSLHLWRFDFFSWRDCSLLWSQLVSLRPGCSGFVGMSILI